MKPRRLVDALIAAAAILAIAAPPAAGFVPPTSPSARQLLAAANPLPYVSSSFTRASLVPGKPAQLAALGATHGFVDRRSGSWGTLLLHTPLVPGDGEGNALSWSGPTPTGSELEE